MVESPAWQDLCQLVTDTAMQFLGERLDDMRINHINAVIMREAAPYLPCPCEERMIIAFDLRRNPEFGILTIVPIFKDELH